MPHIAEETRSDASKESSKLLWKPDIMHEGKKEQKRGQRDERAVKREIHGQQSV